MEKQRPFNHKGHEGQRKTQDAAEGTSTPSACNTGSRWGPRKTVHLEKNEPGQSISMAQVFLRDVTQSFMWLIYRPQPG